MRRMAIKGSSAKKRRATSESNSILAQPEKRISSSEAREMLKLNKIFKSKDVIKEKKKQESQRKRSARKIIEEYVEHPSE